MDDTEPSGHEPDDALAHACPPALAEGPAAPEAHGPAEDTVTPPVELKPAEFEPVEAATAATPAEVTTAAPVETPPRVPVPFETAATDAGAAEVTHGDGIAEWGVWGAPAVDWLMAVTQSDSPSDAASAGELAPVHDLDDVAPPTEACEPALAESVAAAAASELDAALDVAAQPITAEQLPLPEPPHQDALVERIEAAAAAHFGLRPRHTDAPAPVALEPPAAVETEAVTLALPVADEPEVKTAAGEPVEHQVADRNSETLGDTPTSPWHTESGLASGPPEPEVFEPPQAVADVASEPPAPEALAAPDGPDGVLARLLEPAALASADIGYEIAAEHPVAQLLLPEPPEPVPQVREPLVPEPPVAAAPAAPEILLEPAAPTLDETLAAIAARRERARALRAAELAHQPAADMQSAPAIAIDVPAPPAAGHSTRRPGFLRRAGRVALRAAAGYLALVLCLIIVYRFVNPPASTLMVYEGLFGAGAQQTWVPLEEMSPHLVRAVVVAEDGRFCDHNGIDLEALEEAIQKARGGLPRGASTISMQVTKNLFLWQSKSFIRKLIELPLTLIMEIVWPKSRILEIYLNIAEWGPGVFGAEAAAQHHFNSSAASLSEREAALLAASLPNPIRRDAGDPGPRTARKAAVIQGRVRAAGDVVACLRGWHAGQLATQKSPK